MCPMFANAQQAVCITYDNAGNRTARFICGAGLDDPGQETAAQEMLAADRDAAATRLLDGQLVPNPNDGRFDVVLGSAVEGGTFDLYGTQGDLVLRQVAEGTHHSFHLQNLPPGNYYLVLRSASGQVLRHWIALKH